MFVPGVWSSNTTDRPLLFVSYNNWGGSHQFIGYKYLTFSECLWKPMINNSGIALWGVQDASGWGLSNLFEYEYE